MEVLSFEKMYLKSVAKWLVFFFLFKPNKYL